MASLRDNIPEVGVYVTDTTNKISLTCPAQASVMVFHSPHCEMAGAQEQKLLWASWMTILSFISTDCIESKQEA